ncbi:hypothetical protein ACH5RR_040775 [Cinchona calisaya]|uniref:Uncharacterized protein n=1 Tax=Cinchona calisaya TaxID=153742 RepID=A0ABD2XSX0_9GENT
MENSNLITDIPGSRHLNLKTSFKLGIRSLLTACSKEDFCKAFPKLTNSEQERLHRLFIQVIATLHENIEAGPILDTVEQHVEEQSLDLLSGERSNIGAVGPTLSDVKKNEIHYLTGLLEKAEEQNRLMSARLDLLKKQRQDFSGAADVVDKLRMEIQSYGACNNTGS